MNVLTRSMVENTKPKRTLPARQNEISKASTRISSSIDDGLSKEVKKLSRACLVNDFVVFYDEVIGKGQFGTVVKA